MNRSTVKYIRPPLKVCNGGRCNLGRSLKFKTAIVPQTFISDEQQVWQVGNPDNGRDLQVIFTDFNNINYDGTVLLDHTETDDGFTPDWGFTVDDDFNFYVITSDVSPSGEAKLWKFSYGDSPSLEFEKTITSNLSDSNGLVYVQHRDELWANDNNEAFKIFDKDGNFIRTVTNQINDNDFASESSAIFYNAEKETIEWLVGGVGGGKAQRDWVRYNPDDETAERFIDIIPEPFFTADPIQESPIIDNDGNYYLIWEAEDGVFEMGKFDSDFNEIWTIELNSDPTGAQGLDIDGAIFYSTNGSNATLHRIDTDENGLNPSHSWSKQIESSGTNSVRIIQLQPERRSSGRILTAHAVSGGFNATTKDGESKKDIGVRPGNPKGFIVLPGLPFSVTNS